jgi:hypothetical protein
MEAISQQVALETLGQSTNGYQVLPTRGTRGGGILFGWNSDFVDATNLSLKEYSLTMNMKLKTEGSSFLLSLCMGPLMILTNHFS